MVFFTNDFIETALNFLTRITCISQKRRRLSGEMLELFIQQNVLLCNLTFCLLEQDYNTLTDNVNQWSESFAGAPTNAATSLAQE